MSFHYGLPSVYSAPVTSNQYSVPSTSHTTHAYSHTNHVESLEVKSNTARKVKGIVATMNRKEFPALKKCYVMDWNGTGNKLACGSQENNIRVYTFNSSFTSCNNTTDLRGHTSLIVSVKFDPDNSDTLLSISHDKTLRVWNTKTGKCTFEIDVKSKFDDMSVSSGGLVALVNEKDGVVIYDFNTGRLVVQKTVFDARCLIFGPLPGFILVNSGGDLLVLDSLSLETKFQIAAHSQVIYHMSLDKSKKFLATSGIDGFVSVWNIEEMICISSFGNHERVPRCVTWSTTSEMIAACGEEPFVDIYDVVTGELVSTVSSRDPIFVAAFHPIHNVLAYSGEEKDSSSRPIISVMSGLSKSSK